MATIPLRIRSTFSCKARHSQLATTIRSRRQSLLNMTIEQAADFAGLTQTQWAALESGWLPSRNGQPWIWWTLAATLQLKVDTLFRLAGSDQLRRSYGPLSSAA